MVELLAKGRKFLTISSELREASLHAENIFQVDEFAQVICEVSRSAIAKPIINLCLYGRIGSKREKIPTSLV